MASELASLLSACLDQSRPLHGEEQPPIYLDYNATTPIHPEVAEAMLPFLQGFGWGNPSSNHYYGQQAKQAIEKARAQVAALIGCSSDEVFFTSGGTESNNWAIKGAARAAAPAAGREAGRPGEGLHLITSAIEHPAVAEVFSYLCEEEGYSMTTLSVDEEGLVDPAAALAAVHPPGLTTVLCSVMHANNEVGSLQPIAEIARLLKPRGVLIHTDASQSVGKVPVLLDELGVDLLTLAGHKLYAPKGIGALFVRRRCRLAKWMHGAGHERGFRAGTENTMLIAGLGQACSVAQRDLEQQMLHTAAMRDRLLEGLSEAMQAAGILEKQNSGVPCRALRVNGPKEAAKRLPNTLSLSMSGVDGAKLLSAVSSQVACSAGSACHSKEAHGSAVLQAMKLPIEFANCTLRLSTGRNTEAVAIDKAVHIIVEGLTSLPE